MKMKNKLQKDLPAQAGQALLIVLLTMGVMLVVSLSVVSRTVSDITVTENEEESLRAFSAAEAGVEEALLQNLVPGQSTNNSLSSGQQQYSVNVTSDSRTTANVRYIYPFKLANGDSATFWFMGHNTNGTLTCSGVNCFTGSTIGLCWGTNGGNKNSATTPAVEVSIVYEQSGQIKIKRFGYDSNSNRRSSNKFSAAGYPTSSCPVNAIDGQYFLTGVNMSLTSIPNYSTPGVLKFMTVKMLYNTDATHPLAFYASSLAPSQAVRVESTGTTGDLQRKIEVVKIFPELPSVFEAAVVARRLVK